MFGRLISVRTDLARAVINQLMEEDRRWALLQLETASDIDKRTIHRILHNELHLLRILARWVLQALTEVQKGLRYAICFVHFVR
ncbi:hypothetical protein TNCV_2733181 [Trichonephila clavipes]|nr:hypothetical protein TNCV_2733181 [Trichonephila clavipes]